MSFYVPWNKKKNTPHVITLHGIPALPAFTKKEYAQRAMEPMGFPDNFPLKKVNDSKFISLHLKMVGEGNPPYQLIFLNSHGFLTLTKEEEVLSTFRELAQKTQAKIGWGTGVPFVEYALDQYPQFFN